MISSSALASSSICLSLFSNSPRNMDPATTSARSRLKIFLSSKISGTSRLLMARARPSTIAVFPTPASPISTGLFLVRLANMDVIRSISAFLPTTGSIFPAAAFLVRSVVKNSRTLPRAGCAPACAMAGLLGIFSFCCPSGNLEIFSNTASKLCSSSWLSMESCCRSVFALLAGEEIMP